MVWICAAGPRSAELTGRHGAVTGVVLSDGSRIDADLVLVGIGAVPRTELAAAAGLKVDNGSSLTSTCAPPIRTSSPPATSPTRTTRVWPAHSCRALGQCPSQGAVAAKAMLGQHAVDVRPSYFFTDQYDLSMEYTGDIGPAGYDQVDLPQVRGLQSGIVFWLYEQRIQAGMNINIWDVADDIERLILSARPINADDSRIRRSGWPACYSGRSDSCR